MISVFNFQEKAPVRTVFEEATGEILFVAKDVCDVLEISKYRDAVSRLDEDERGSVVLDTPGGNQEMTAINESGLYSLIFKSRKPEAKAFKKWVTSEVLPSIRKTGSYIAPASKPLSAVVQDMKSLAIASKFFGLEGNQLKLSVNKAVKNRHGVDLMEELGVTALIAPTQDAHLTVSDIAKRMGYKSAIYTNKVLTELGFQKALCNSKNKIYYEVLPKGRDYSVVLDTNKKHSDGTPIIQIKWLSSILDQLPKELI